MKRAIGEGTIREKRKGLWEGRYTVGYDTDGKRIRKSVYGKTQKEVVDKLSTITNDIRSGMFLPPEQITFGQWLDIWSEEYLEGVKESTATQYKYHIEFNIKPLLGSVQLQKLTAPMIQKMYKKRMTEPMKGGKVLSPKSIKNLHGVIHKALDKAVQCRYLKFNPSDACELPRIPKKEMQVLSGKSNSLQLFLEEIKGKQFESLFFVDVFTGLREGEIVGLTWDNVDFDNGVIHVVKQLKRKAGKNNRYFFDTLKNGKTRIVAPAPVVFDVLRKVRKEQAENRLKYGTSYNNEMNLVFTNELGEHIGIENLWQCFKRRVTAIGLPDMRFHDLRHTYATLSIQNGDDIKTVSESLGHATVAFTLDVYGHVTDTMRKASADRMQAFIESIGG